MVFLICKTLDGSVVPIPILPLTEAFPVTVSLFVGSTKEKLPRPKLPFAPNLPYSTPVTVFAPLNVIVPVDVLLFACKDNSPSL